MAQVCEVQLRTVYLYEWLRGTTVTSATNNINAALGGHVTSLATIRRWYARFASGDTSLEIDPRSGRPTTVDDKALLRTIQRNPEATTRELANTLGCAQRSVVSHLNALDYHKVMARWIPHRLTDAQRSTRATICQSLLLRPRRKEFLADLVTGDESWILYDNTTRSCLDPPRRGAAHVPQMRGSPEETSPLCVLGRARRAVHGPA